MPGLRIALPRPFAPPPADRPYLTAELGEAFPNMYLYFFTNVSNISDLKKKIICGKSEVPQCAMIDASAVIDLKQVELSVFKAMSDARDAKMRTKSVWSEVLWNLNPTTNISDALKNFGLGPETKHLIVVASEEVEELLRAVIDGDQAGIEMLAQRSDLARVRKLYKIPADIGDSGFLDFVLESIACKDLRL